MKHGRRSTNYQAFRLSDRYSRYIPKVGIHTYIHMYVGAASRIALAPLPSCCRINRKDSSAKQPADIGLGQLGLSGWARILSMLVFAPQRIVFVFLGVLGRHVCR